MNNELNQIVVSRKKGDEQFISNGNYLEKNILSFWQWAYSDLSNNTIRGILAEYIVASELGISKTIRQGWDAYDLLTIDGIKIEVKSASYLQSWKQSDFSKIQFTIAPTKGWSASTNEYDDETKRQADIYIFCLLHHKEKSTLNPINLDQWTFYILPASILNNAKPNQKQISLSALLKLEPLQVKYGQIGTAINGILLMTNN